MNLTSFWWKTTQNKLILTTPSLVIFLVIIYWLSTFDKIHSPNLFMNLANNGPLVYQGEWYRMFTAPILHYSQQHLITNITTLLLLGYGIERLIGSQRLLLVYIMAGLFGSIISASFNSPTVFSVGASGAIMGLLGYLICTKLLDKHAVSTEVFLWAILISIGNLSWTGQSHSIDLFAHLGGFIGGFFSVWIIGLPTNPYLEEQTIHPHSSLKYFIFILWILIVSLPLYPFGHKTYLFIQSII